MYISYKKFFWCWWIIHEIGIGKKKKEKKKRRNEKANKNKQQEIRAQCELTWLETHSFYTSGKFCLPYWLEIPGKSHVISRNPLFICSMVQTHFYFQHSGQCLCDLSPCCKKKATMWGSLFVMAICCTLHDILRMFTHIRLPLNMLKCCKKQLARQSKSTWPHGKFVGMQLDSEKIGPTLGVLEGIYEAYSN